MNLLAIRFDIKKIFKTPTNMWWFQIGIYVDGWFTFFYLCVTIYKQLANQLVKPMIVCVHINTSRRRMDTKITEFLIHLQWNCWAWIFTTVTDYQLLTTKLWFVCYLQPNAHFERKTRTWLLLKNGVNIWIIHSTISHCTEISRHSTRQLPFVPFFVRLFSYWTSCLAAAPNIVNIGKIGTPVNWPFNDFYCKWIVSHFIVHDMFHR